MRKSIAVQKDEENNNNSAVSPSANGRQLQQSGSYSSIVGSVQAQNGAETRTARGDNPFKYGKDEMMQVYSSLVGDSDKITHTPLDFERYEQVTSPLPVQPTSMNDLTEDEKALLASNINSEQKPRRTEVSEGRQNGRRDNRQNGTRDAKKHTEPHRRNGETSHNISTTVNNGRVTAAPNEVEDHGPHSVPSTKEVPVEDVSEVNRESFSQPSGRNTSRLTSMGVFDSGNLQDNPSFSKWKDEKEDDVLKEAMGYANDSNKQDIDRLAEMYQNQTLGNGQQPPQTSRGFSEQAYNPLANGMPDLFSKTPAPGAAFSQAPQQVTNPRAGFADSVPSPGLQPRQDQPMTTRVMVMPDKLKWQYRDPTGQNQGPFSGLEMHDWYKAGFFQPNLLVKREEDEEFEPLSILVRRIGNQREPFLVPLPSRVTTATQIARPGSQEGKEQWPNGPSWSSGGQPPFPQSFPSFGTTLTAEQQNALERRKQEEQYLMHRQREFLQQQQMAQQMAAQRLLHHQHPYGHAGGSFGYGADRRSSPFSSGSERQGSMGSFDVGGGGGGHSGWGGYAPQNQNAPRGQYTDFGAGIFDTPKSEVADLTFREPERFVESNAHDESQNSRRFSEQHSVSRTSLEAKLQPSDYASRMAQQAQAMQKRAQATNMQTQIETRAENGGLGALPQMPTSSAVSDLQGADDRNPSGGLAAQESSATERAYEMSKNSSDAAVLGETLATPTTPAAAPWAAAASSRGNSLREIQEIEARRDALRRQAERKAALDAKAHAESQAPLVSRTVVSVPLNWAIESASEQSGTPGSLGAAWKASSGTPGKKTLAQIQQEEESAARARVVAQSRNAATIVPSNNPRPVVALGTRYADTAMKPAASWSTVGNGSKNAAVPIQRTEPKSVSATSVPPRPKLASAPSAQTTYRSSDPDAISPEFLGWARSALKGLNPGVNFSEFLQLLLSFGTDGGKDTREIISDSIYANSATMDGRRFADEWSKRRKEDLKNTNGQNKSISELTSTLASSSASANDWSDVVKTKPGKQDTEEEWNSSFKVQAKKSGKRK